MRLAGKKGLIAGLANEQSIAFGCASALARQGAEVGLTCRNEKAIAYAKPAADKAGAAWLMPMDVSVDGAMETVFDRIAQNGGKLDFLVHSIAFCNATDLHGQVRDVSRQGFAEAMDISCHSFLRMARLAAPLMPDGGCLLATSFFGSEQVVPGYGIMGPVKAALEASVRYLAVELGPEAIRVNALSPGPIRTRAAGGLADFDRLIADAQQRTPLPALATIEDVGEMAAFLVSDEARAITGAVLPVDSGYSILSGAKNG